MSAPKTLNGKIVLQAYLLDNSYKTLLIEPTSTVHVRPTRAETGGLPVYARSLIGPRPHPPPLPPPPPFAPTLAPSARMCAV